MKKIIPLTINDKRVIPMTAENDKTIIPLHVNNSYVIPMMPTPSIIDIRW